MTDMPRPGCPTVSEKDVQNVNALVFADRSITIRELADNVGLAHFDILTANTENRLQMVST